MKLIKYFFLLILFISLSVKAQTKSKNIYILFDNDKDIFVQTVKDSVETFFYIHVKNPNPWLFVNYRKSNEKLGTITMSEYEKMKSQILDKKDLEKLSDEEFEAVFREKKVFIIDIRNTKSIKKIFVKNEDYILP